MFGQKFFWFWLHSASAEKRDADAVGDLVSAEDKDEVVACISLDNAMRVHGIS